MVNWKSRAFGDFLLLANGVALVVLINVVASGYFFRMDLTEEQRYSMKPPTKELLRGLEDDVYIEVYLEGELNAGFRRFQKSIRETLEEFRLYSGNKIHYSFVDPTLAMGDQAQNEFMRELASKGIQPTNVIDNANGQRVEKIIFPGVLISYGGFETGVSLLKGNKAHTPDEEINQSIEGIEYELANAIQRLVNENPKRIALMTGHGELDSLYIASFNNALLEQYEVFKVDLSKKKSVENYDAVIVAKPRAAFSETDKYKLDQYIINGGSVVFLIDKLEATMDSASRDDYFAFPYNLNLDDQLFKYGVRLNFDLVQDRSAGMYPVITGQTGGKPRWQLLEWPYFPLINRYADHPITHNLDAVVTKFTSSIDTVKAEGITKTPLLFTSQASRTVTAPVKINVNDLRKDITPEAFTKSFIPVGYLLEGNFTSLYKNRFLPEGADQASFKEKNKTGKVVVIADGDIARNDVNPRNGQPQLLGFDPLTNYTFANQELLLNILAYVTNENGLIRARNKEVKIRPLDHDRIASEKTKWQVINLVVPVLLISAFGFVRIVLRKRKYARH